jgi:ABC-2 type transport system permease protein
MNQGVFPRNFRHAERLLVTLCVATAAAEVLFVHVAAALDMGPGVANMVQMLPGSVRAMFGEQLALASFSAAIAFGFQHPAIVGAGLAFVIAACTIPAAERESGVLDLLLARPIPRWRYLASVLALALVGVLLFLLTLLVGNAVGLATVTVPSELPWTRYASSAAGLGILLFAFTGIALALGATARRRGQAIARIVGLVLTLYLVDVFAERLAWMAWLRWASPFHYFRPVQSAVFQQTSLMNLAVLVAIGVVCAAVAFVRFEREDV